MRGVAERGRMFTLRVEQGGRGATVGPFAHIPKQPKEKPMPAVDYSKELGERLRKIRIQKGMSLQDVQQASKGKWKAAVVGAYERGDRNVTVARLSELADFYGVPVSEILPDDGVTSPGPVEVRRRVVL